MEGAKVRHGLITSIDTLTLLINSAS